MMNQVYRRTQPGTLVVLTLLCGVVLAGAVAVSTDWHPVTLAAGSILIVALILFRSLTIEIDTSELRCFFGDGFIRRRFSLSEITSAIPVRNKWYYGWGVRLTPSGWMFNVSGLDAVEITLISGKRFRIGTDKPNKVVEAIIQSKK